MITLTEIAFRPQSTFYELLLGKVDAQLLHLQDIRGTFLLDKLSEKNLNYYMNQVSEKPWNNHLILVALVYADRNSDIETIYKLIKTINPRLTNIFEVFHLNEMVEFDVNIHLYEYFKGSVFRNHSNDMKSKLLSYFRSIAYITKRWVTTKLNKMQQAYFEKYLFPMPSYDSRDFSFTKSAREQAQITRKSETDALVPLLPKIRAEGHFRWNQLNRLRQAFLKACEQAKTTNCKLPIDFHYDEPERIGERYYFRLWNKSSFILQCQDQFSIFPVNNSKYRLSDKSHFFIEFVKAERIDDGEDVESLWFLELFEKGVIGQWSRQENNEEIIKKKRELLNSLGYGEEGSTRKPVPFYSGHRGIITPSTFISLYQEKAEGVLFEVEQLYVAATFGLLALDIFTTTGARLNELLQINYTKECIKTIKFDNKLHHSFYAIPKGRDEAESFYISDQTMKLIAKVIKLLKYHYDTEKIPKVEYRHQRKHLFPEPKPYIFQYNYKAFKDNTIYSCLRFLLHGLDFHTQEGDIVTVKTHLLRHAFATEAVQRQKLPIDILAKILHQRDLGVTAYYSEPTPSQVAQSVSDLHDIISDYVDLDEAVLRSPEELEKHIEEYKEKVGVFNNVVGGVCVTNHVCPIKMQCLGCHAKIPQPEKKHELLEVIELSKDMEKRYGALGLTVDVKKTRVMRKHARNELREIELIEKYREDQGYEPHIQFDK